MKNWFKRFGMLAVLGMLVGGALVAGCNPEAPGEAPDQDVDVIVPADGDGTDDTVVVEEAPAPEPVE